MRGPPLRKCNAMPTLHLPERGKPVPASSFAARAGWLALGLGFVAFGIIGAILPLMPTTIFLILAAACFARSSPRLEHWLLEHARFGPALRAWRAERAIPRRAKAAACLGMLLGYLLFILATRPGSVEAAAAAAALGGCALWIVRQPVPASEKAGK